MEIANPVAVGNEDGDMEIAAPIGNEDGEDKAVLFIFEAVL